MPDDRRWGRHQHPAEESPVAGPDDEAGKIGRCDPGEHGECGARDSQPEDGDRGDVRAEEVGDDAAKGGGAVDDGDHVEGEAAGGVQLGARVRGDVEERDVVCQHDAGEGGREEHEGEVGEGAPFDHAAGAGLLAWFAAEDEDGHEP